VRNVIARSFSDEAISGGPDCFAALAMTQEDICHNP
jgi:hypothetical protein